MTVCEDYFVGYSTGVDLDGKQVERSRLEYPYSYDGYVTYRNGSNDEIDGEFYTDRIMDWDSDKFNSLWQKHTKGERVYIHDTKYTDVKVWESFLREYFDAPNLKIIVMMDYCNRSSGYEIGRILYRKGI